MKTLFSSFGIFLFLSLFLFSCKKEANDPGGNPNDGGYYVKFKKDNVQIIYKGSVEAQVNTVLSSGNYLFAVSGLDKAFVADKNALTLSVSSNEKINTATTYVNYVTSNASYKKTDVCNVAIFDSNGDFFASWGDEFSSFAIVSDTKINLTEITDKYVKGTFYGTAYKEINGASEHYLISEGEFYAPVK